MEWNGSQTSRLTYIKNWMDFVEFCYRHHELVDLYEISIHQMAMNVFHLTYISSFLHDQSAFYTT